VNERDMAVVCSLFGIVHLNVAENKGKVGVVPVHAMVAYRWCGGIGP
jgi:hypothetical protein